MKLPSKLTLGNKPKKPNLVLGGPPAQAQAAAKVEEDKKTVEADDPPSPKYSSAEVKLFVM